MLKYLWIVLLTSGVMAAETVELDGKTVPVSSLNEEQKAVLNASREVKTEEKKDDKPACVT